MTKRRPIVNISTAGVYLLFLGSELVYVGQSSCIESRIREHVRARAMEFDHYSLIPVERRDERLRIEKDLIRKRRPIAQTLTLEQRGFVPMELVSEEIRKRALSRKHRISHNLFVTKRGKVRYIKRNTVSA